MKILVVLMALSSPAWSAKKPDYSGCMPNGSEYQIADDGTLVGATKTEDNKMEWNTGKTKYVLTLNPETGRPYSLKKSYPGEKGGTATILTTFNYDRKKRCFINEVLHVDPARTGKKQNVVYYHDLCEDLEKFHDPNKPQNRRKLEKTYQRIGKVLEEYQAKFSKKKNKTLLVYNEKKFQEDPAKVSNDIVRSCIKIREAYPYPYKFTWGAFEFKNFKFDGIPYHEEKEQEEGTERGAD